MKPNISSGIKGLKSVITANSPVLLAGAAIAGTITTGVLAARAGYKARGIVEEERMRRVTSPEPPFDTFLDYYKTYVDKADPLTYQDKAKLTWLCYAAPAATGVSTIASIAGVHLIHTKRHAALAGAYALATTKLDDMSEKAEELLGPKKAQQLRQEMSQKDIERLNIDPDNADIVLTGQGTELTVDGMAGRPFYSSMNKIDAAVNKINAELGRESNVSLNDLYDYMNLDSIPLGDVVGWSGAAGDVVETKYDPVQLSDGRAVNSVTFRPAPTPGYRKR